ncbi:MAG: hypothetical protein QF814_03715 [Candidatus Marinimicrobia bacterium]|jgi:tRNA(Phe) wybutosine-synthesizing methylase Tyw3|nr:hypothetical protein [Candidatus Neomarinimicrobiota bacterium]
MKKNLIMLLISMFIFQIGCEDKDDSLSTNPIDESTGFNASVKNSTSNQINVKIGNVEFGDISTGQTSEYLMINGGQNNIYVNSQVYMEFDFETLQLGGCEEYWDVRIDDGGGYSISYSFDLLDCP